METILYRQSQWVCHQQQQQQHCGALEALKSGARKRIMAFSALY